MQPFPRPRAESPPLKALSSIAALLASVAFLIAGGSLANLLTPLRADVEGFGDLAIGALGSSYYLGMWAGTLLTPAIIRRSGHIRAFAAFVSLGIGAINLMPVWVAPAPWIAFRIVLGFVFAGLYAIIEAWINASATNSNRGAMYGTYQIVNFAASAGGQLLLSAFVLQSFAPFAVSASLVALGIAPLALTQAEAPPPPTSVRLRPIWLAKLAPVAVAAAFVAGAANGATASLGGIYALRIGVAPQFVPVFTSAIVLGSAIGVLPVGLLSDRFDRRIVMVAMMAAGALVEFALAAFAPAGLALVGLGFAVGLTTYTLYTLSTSHANDRAKAQDMVLIAAGLLFVYCIGAILAPSIAAQLMRVFGPRALFVQNGMLHAALAAFAAAGIFRVNPWRR